MKKSIVLLAMLALLLGTAAPSDAWRGHGGWRGGCCWGWWWPGAVIGGLALGAAVATAPLYWAPPPVYAAPPALYQPPAPVIYQQAPPPAFAAPLVQREVVYSNGRYVLYGDGVSRPWQWVWMPAQPQ